MDVVSSAGIALCALSRSGAATNRGFSLLRPTRHVLKPV